MMQYDRRVVEDMKVIQTMNGKPFRHFRVRNPKKQAFWKAFVDRTEGKTMGIDTIIHY